MLQKIIKTLYYLLFFITPLVMFPHTSELFEFNKILVIYVLTAFIGFMFLLDAILFKREIRYKYLYLFLLGVFFLTQLISTVFSIDIHTSIMGYYGRFNGGLLSLFAYITLAFVMLNISLQKSDIIRLLQISLISSTIVIAWALPGKYGHDLSCLIFTGQFTNACWTNQFDPASRAFSTLGQPNWMGAYLAVNFFIALYFFLSYVVHTVNAENNNITLTKVVSYIKQNNYFILLGIYLFLNLSSILFTRSRSSIGAVGIGVILLAFWMMFNWVGSNRSKIIMLLLLIIFPIVFFKTGVDKIDQLLRPHFSTTKPTAVVPAKTAHITTSGVNSDITESFDIRKIVWNGAIALGREYPLFGTGVETFGYSYYFVRPQAHNLVSEWDFLYNKAHNEYLNYFATTGVVGTGSYLILILFVIGYLLKQSLNMRAMKEDKSLWNTKLLIICLLLGYSTILVTNFFGFSTTTINVFFYLLPVLVMVYVDSHSSQQTIKKMLTWKEYTAFIVATGFLCYSLYFLYNYFSADLKYAQSEIYAQQSEFQPAAALLQRALSQHYEHVYEDKLSYNLANLAFLASYQKQSTAAKTLVQLSKYYNDKSILASPEDVLYWKTKAKNAYLFYQIAFNTDYLKEGIEALDNARKLAPTDPKVPYSKALFYSLLEDESNAKKQVEERKKYQDLALVEIDKSLVLKDNYRDAYFLKAQLQEKYGQTDYAKETLEYILKNINPQDEEAKAELNKIQE